MTADLARVTAERDSAVMANRPTTRAIINGGSVIKGGTNTTSQVTVRPPPPTPTKPPKHPKIEAAIETQPDPRDAVITGLETQQWVVDVLMRQCATSFDGEVTRVGKYGRIWPVPRNNRRKRFCAWFESYMDIHVKHFPTRQAAADWLRQRAGEA